MGMAKCVSGWIDVQSIYVISDVVVRWTPPPAITVFTAVVPELVGQAWSSGLGLMVGACMGDTASMCRHVIEIVRLICPWT